MSATYDVKLPLTSRRSRRRRRMRRLAVSGSLCAAAHNTALLRAAVAAPDGVEAQAYQ